MKKHFRYLIMTGVIFAAWPFIICRPLRLFSSLLHDAGHSVGAFFAGFGSSAFDGSFSHGAAGLAAEGNNWFRVLVAVTFAYLINLALGYILLSMSVKNIAVKRYFVGTTSILLLVLAFNYSPDYLTMLFTVIYVCLAIVMFMIDKDYIYRVLLEVMGLTMFMFVVYDTLVDTILFWANSALHISNTWVKPLPSDSDVLAAATSVPAVIWAVVWFAACALLYWRAIRNKSIIGGRKKHNA